MTATVVIAEPQTTVNVLEEGAAVVTERVVVQTVTVGVEGPQGPPGSANASYPALNTLSGHIAVTLDAMGRAFPANALTAAHGAAVVGITTGATVAGALATVIDSGTLELGGWNFTVGQPVLLGANGQITQTPASGAVFVKVLGVAVSPTKIIVSIQPAIYF